MPKIRGIHPDFWTDEAVVELSPFSRLLFLGLWNYACDNGHLQDKSKQIKRRVLPDDDVNCAELLAEIEAQGLIERADGWITIPNLTRRQKPDVRYWLTCEKRGCEAPDRTHSQRAARRAHTVHTPGAQGVHDGRTVGALGDGDGDGDVKVSGKAAAKRATALPKDFAPNDTHQRIATERGLDLKAVVIQFEDFHRAKGSTFKDWDAALRTWLRNERPQQVARLHALPQPAMFTAEGLPIIDKSDDRR